MKPRYALRAKLLDAMQACPSGKRLETYADDIGYSRQNVSQAGAMLAGLGQAVYLRVGRHVLWTATEHEAALHKAAEDERARYQAELEASGVLAERKAKARARKNAALQRHRERKRALKPAATTRYRWPDEVAYQEPARLVRSVWELACM